MTAADNEKVMDEGFAKGLAMIEEAFKIALHYASVELVHTALYNREYTGFTGNTQTSYTCGVFLNGKLVDVVSSGESQPSPGLFHAKPVRRKIPMGKDVFLQRPYEGNPRQRHGYVKTNREYGSETALKFINSYRAPRKGLALVMTTGTEYSEFLEQEAGLDVLTKTFKDAPSILAKNWRPIP